MVNLDCIPISAYCQYTGESIDAINKRLQRQFWIEGVHVLKVNGAKERWIDLAEVSKWARKNKMNILSLEG
ncbi:excisionase [Xenorhabdus bovienii]|uniref:excisionase n=1 Tax=Xenorhabdus bovienii TaxID=40576 RepID=UPI0023B21B1D|nr:excisionase [Xenorhabdus bovienii]MDE9545357.1 excisionase [Xenorhabdus bovienii]